MKRKTKAWKRWNDKIQVSKIKHNIEHKEDITKQIKEGDTIQIIKESKLTYWKIIPSHLVDRRILINGRNHQWLIVWHMGEVVGIQQIGIE